MPTAKKFLKWFGLSLGGLLALSAAGLTLGYGWLRSDSGSDWLARQIEQAVNSPGEIELSIGRLDGDLPAEVRLRELVLRDAGGEWLTAEAVEVRWDPWALLNRTLQIEALTFTKVDLSRLPAASAEDDDAEISRPHSAGLPTPPLPVRLRQLAADEIALGAPVLGQAARFTLAGNASGQEDGSLAAGLELRRLDGAEAKLLAELKFDPGGDQLTARVNASEAPGGLISSLLDLPDLPRTELRLDGSGPLSDWKGDFALSLGSLANAEAGIAIGRPSADAFVFKVDGHGELNPSGDDPAWDLLRGRTDIALAGTWQTAGRLQMHQLAARGPVLALESQGTFEPESRGLDLTLKASAPDAMPLAGLLDFDRLQSLAAEIAMTGTLDQPDALVTLRAEGIAAPEFVAAAAELRGQVKLAGELRDPASRLALDLSGEIDRPELLGQDDINSVLGAALTWTLQGDLAPDSLELQIAALDARAEHARISSSGPFNMERGGAQLQVTLTVPDLAALESLTEIALGGSATLTGPVRLTGFGRSLEAELQGRWDQPSSGIALLTAAAGKGMDLALGLNLDGATVRVKDLKARSQIAELAGELTVNSSPVSLDGRYSLALPDATRLARELAADFSGPARIDGDITGPLKALRLEGKLQVQQLTVEQQVLRDLRGSYRLDLRGAEVVGPVALALTSPFGPAEAKGDLKVRPSTVSLSALEARLRETTVRGEVVVPLDKKPPVVTLDAEIDNLEPWLTAAGVSGTGQGTVSLKLNAPNTSAPLQVAGDFNGVTVVPQPDAAVIGAERLTIDFQAQDTALKQRASIKLRGEGVSREDLELRHLDLDGQGVLQDLELALRAQGNWVEALELHASARLRRDGDDLFVTLNQAEGRAFGHPLSLRQPAELSRTPTETRLQNFDLASGKTRLTADARLGGEQIAVTAALEALPMTTVDAVWQSGLNGVVSAQLDLEGPVEAPRGTAKLTATGLNPRGSQKLPPLELTASADWQAGRIALEGQLGGAQVAAARFSGEGPLQLSAEGNGLEIPTGGMIGGQASWSGDAATLLLFVPLPQHRLKGQTNVALDIAGTVGKPDLNGSMTLTEGRYENLDSGTVLRKLDMEIRFAEDRVTLTRLSASDGGKGKLSGQGELLIDADRGHPLDFAIALERFRALERDEVMAIVGGTIRAAGTAQAPEIEGRLTTETVEVSLANDLPPDVITLEVIEIRNGQVQQKAEKPKAEAPVTAALDIEIDMPRRVFVRGRGLDSEWAGRIAVQGTSTAPEVSGELNLVRGQMSVVGKAFRLSEGKVTLPATANSDPQLDVAAVHKGRDIEVTARLSGPVTEPELELTSVPEVPRDEIISRVLFGKTAAQLTAAEAAQLALAVRDLTGRGGSTDILGFARRTVGVDVLRVDTTETGAASVEAGKYLTDQVYVGVKQGGTSETSGAAVEVELTPNITVESEVTGSGANKSGVRFQLDY